MVPPVPPHSIEPAIRQRTARALGDRDPDLAGILETQDSTSPLTVVQVRAVVVRLRSMMMDATFDDTHLAADISETSELYELWRQHLARVG